MSWNSRYTNEKTAGDPSFWHQLGEVLNPIHRSWNPGSGPAGQHAAEAAAKNYYENIAQNVTGNPADYASVTGPGGVAGYQAVTDAGTEYAKTHQHINVPASLTSMGVDSALGYGVIKGLEKVKNLLQRNN